MYILKDNKKVFQLKANYPGVGGWGGRAPKFEQVRGGCP